MFCLSITGLEAPMPASNAGLKPRIARPSMTIVARNTGDFEGIGATIINPWEGA
jgi:hypothetical protein